MSEKFFSRKITEDSSQSAINASRNWHFSLKSGESAKIAVLNHDDEDIPPMHYHMVKHGSGIKKIACMASDDLEGKCHFCEYSAAQPENEQWRTRVKKEYCYTILDDRGELDPSGNPRPPKKRLRLSSVKDHKNLGKKRKFITETAGRDGLRLEWLTVYRDGELEKQPAIGTLDQVIGVQVDPDDFEEGFLEPFTFDEILVHFVTEIDEINELAESFQIGRPEEGAVGIREV